MKKIKLTKGYFAIVDDEDFEWLNKYSWYVNLGTSTPRAIARIEKRKYGYMHRLILNAPAHLDVDHINRNGLDNRRCNLRLATRTQNNGNKVGNKRGHSSKFKGVYFNKSKKQWVANGYANSKTIYLGESKDEVEAAKIYDEWAKEYFGEFARLNFPNE